MNETPTTKLLVSFRGKKSEFDVQVGLTVLQVKEAVSVADGGTAGPSDIKLIHRGKILSDDSVDLFELLIASSPSNKPPPKMVRLMATGVSSAEASAADKELEEGKRKANIQVRDDLTTAGLQREAERRRLGQRTLAAAAARDGASSLSTSKKYGFGKIETLPMLPDADKAREILETLANDPGIRACMAKHEWNVGCLAELFPEGKVGESEVCVMGLNENKGQRILLRIRTDDLKGFRKMLSIRKVLYHELAHNVHSEHDGDFFLLMRQIERECNELDWTKGSGSALGGDSRVDGGDLMDTSGSDRAYVGGTFRLGGGSSDTTGLSTRELAARAAMMRMTAEEEEIEFHCGCRLPPKRSEEEMGDSKPSRMDTEDS